MTVKLPNNYCKEKLLQTSAVFLIGLKNQKEKEEEEWP
jgi:hypothetical protein